MTVTGITASNKVYDGTTDATLDTSGATLVGVATGDTVTLEHQRRLGTFDSPDVGTGKTVTVTGLSLSGADAGNYILVQPTTTAEHHPRHPDRHGHHRQRARCTTAPPTRHPRYHWRRHWSGVVAGDDVTLDAGGATGTFDTKDVGTGKTVTVTGLSLAAPPPGTTSWPCRRRPRTSRRRP